MHSETLGHWLRLETNPLSCSQCGYKVARLSKLKKHEKTHLAIDIYKTAESRTKYLNFDSTAGGDRENNEKKWIGSIDTKVGETLKRVELKSFDGLLVKVGTPDPDQELNGHQKTYNDPNDLLSTDAVVDHQNQNPKNNLIVVANKYIKRENRKRIRGGNRKKSSFICTQCGVTTTRKFSLEDHMKAKHNVGTKIQCTHCERQFASKSKLKQHIENKHIGNRFICSHCGLTTSDKYSLRDHTISKHKEGIMLQCMQCKKEFATKRALKQHAENKHEGKRYQCQYCAHESTQFCNLKTHIRKKHNVDSTVFENRK